MPYDRNPFFTGRKGVLTHMRSVLIADSSTLVTQPPALSGLGGVGKTQTALEYAYRYRAEYDAVFWVRAETEVELLTGFEDVARILDMPEKDIQDGNMRVRAVMRWLESHDRWLLILDNADDLQLARRFLPKHQRGHVILTTRAAATGAVAKPVQVDVLTPEEGALLLLLRAKLLPEDASLEAADESDLADALVLAKELGGLPLAIDQAGAFLEETGTTPVRYLELYHKYGIDLLKERSELSPGDHSSVVFTFSIAFEKVELSSQAAADLVRSCAFLAPDAIAEEILTQGAAELGEALAIAAADELEWERTVQKACRYSLLSREPHSRTLTAHRLVQKIIRDSMDEPTKYRWSERIMRVLVNHLQKSEFSIWPLFERLRSSAEFYAQWLETEHLELPDMARFFNNLAMLYHAQGWFDKAESLYAKALVIRQQSSQSNQVEIAETLNCLANLYSNRQEYAKAESLHRWALTIREQELGLHHADVATTLNNLAMIYKVQDDYQKAEPLLHEALRIRKHLFNSDHPDVAVSLHNLATLYHDQGKFAKAKPLYEEALAIEERLLGPDHSEVAVSVSNLADLYLALGQFDRAEHLLQREINIRTRCYGETHAKVAASLRHYSQFLYAIGENDRADKIEARIDAIYTSLPTEKKV